MLRPVSTNISVITNFGCNSKCWYCIWKGHRLENVRLDTDWVKLEDFLSINKQKGKVSVSGGGDSLYEYSKYKDWWDRFFNLTDKYRLLVDIHTREHFVNDSFWKNINRCAFSSDSLKKDRDYLLYLCGVTKVRICHLVTEETTIETIEEYLNFQNETGCQFTIKELVGFDDGGKYQLIKKEFPQIYHLDKGDYNIYFMPDNTARENFL